MKSEQAYLHDKNGECIMAERQDNEKTRCSSAI